MSLLPVFHKTRIAPTPSGFLHLGNAFSFALTAALARKTGAGILLRIDDLDRERARREYVEDVFDTLRFLGIPWDEGPRDFEEYDRLYSQRHRVGAYAESLRLLAASGMVFGCSCSRSDISGGPAAPGPLKGKTVPAKIPEHPVKAARGYPGTCRSANIPLNTPGINWRLNTSAEVQLEVKTGNGSPVRACLPQGMKDFVVRRKDGLPAYQLSSVLDDLRYGVDFIVRGEDLWESTLAQLYLSGFLPDNRFREISFYHHSLLSGEGGRKLSKSEGAASLQFLRKQSRTPAEVYALIAAGIGSREKPTCWQEMGELIIDL